MEYMIGCNYWGGKESIEMWRNWDAQSVRCDLEELYKYGCRVLRVFPTWRDFQPIYPARSAFGSFREAYMHDESKVRDPHELDADCVSHFHEFCGMCREIGFKLVVSIVTGWMSGKLYVPPIAENLNLITDVRVLRWEERFVKAIVNEFKEEDVIAAWDLGNECNCMAGVNSSDSAFVWTALIANTIKASDNTRPVMSGMHSLSPCAQYSNWTIQDQGELVDVMTTHPYFTSANGIADCFPDEMRSDIIATVQTQFYADVSGKPAMMQEHGTFTEQVMNPDCAARDVKLQTLSGFFNGSVGMLFWCGCDFQKLTGLPYNWTEMEGSIGLIRRDRTPKPTAYAMKESLEILEKIGKIPEKECDAAVFIGLGQEYDETYLSYAVPTFALAKQAGIDVKFYAETNEVPDADIYICPSTTRCGGTGAMSSHYKIMEKVREGATLYVSFNGGTLFDFEELTGLRSNGYSARTGRIECDFGGEHFVFDNVKPMRLENISAEVLIEDEEHNVLYARKKHGKGWVYFNAIGIEKSIYDNDRTAFTADNKSGYHKFYKVFCENAAAGKPILSNNESVLLTHHKCGEGEYIVSAINYSPREQATSFEIKQGYSVEVMHGERDKIAPNDVTVLKLIKK